MATKITLEKINGRVHETIYGQFIEQVLTCINGGIYDPESPFAGADGMRTDVIEKAQRLHPPVLRFPGGTVMCQYHWEDAVGPMEERITRKNLIWGGETDPSFGTAEFVIFCRKIGAEPMICINMASGTPEEAGNWVEYCNGTGNSYYANLRRKHGYEEPFNVKYWCIGNESYAEPDIGVHHDVNLYIRDAWEFIKFMKLTDDSIKTIIVGCDKEEWNKPVLDSLHAVTDYFSVHYYAGEGEKGLYEPFEGEVNLKKMIQKVSDLINTYPEKVTDFNPWYRFSPRSEKIQIALDEWNIWNFANDETYGLLPTYCWRDALWVASILNFLVNEPSITMANMAQMVNVIAPIIAEEKGSWFQTIGYPLQLLRNTMLGERIQVSCDSPKVDGGAAGILDAISVSAVRNEDGTIHLSVINRDMENAHEICICENKSQLSDTENHNYNYDCLFAALTKKSKMTMTTLTADSPRAVCSLEESCVHEESMMVSADRIVLPAGSVNLITIQS